MEASTAQDQELRLEDEEPKLQEPEKDKPEDDDALDLFEPRMEPVERRLGPLGDNRIVLFQKPLSFLGRWEWYALMGKAISDLMDSEKGVTLAQLLDSIGISPGQTVDEQMSQAEVLIRGFARLSEVAPDLITDCFMIWLNVPMTQREGVRRLMALPVDEGGFDDDTGFDIIECFIEQNAVEILAFFSDRLPQLAQTGAKIREFADHRRSSRASRRSQRRGASR